MGIANGVAKCVNVVRERRPKMANNRALATAFEWPDPPPGPGGYPVHRLTLG